MLEGAALGRRARSVRNFWSSGRHFQRTNLEHVRSLGESLPAESFNRWERKRPDIRELLAPVRVLFPQRTAERNAAPRW